MWLMMTHGWELFAMVRNNLILSTPKRDLRLWSPKNKKIKNEISNDVQKTTLTRGKASLCSSELSKKIPVVSSLYIQEIYQIQLSSVRTRHDLLKARMANGSHTILTRNLDTAFARAGILHNVSDYFLNVKWGHQRLYEKEIGIKISRLTFSERFPHLRLPRRFCNAP